MTTLKVALFFAVVMFIVSGFRWQWALGAAAFSWMFAD